MSSGRSETQKNADRRLRVLSALKDEPQRGIGALACLAHARVTGGRQGLDEANEVLREIRADDFSECGYYWVWAHDVRCYLLFHDRPELLFPKTAEVIRQRLWRALNFLPVEHNEREIGRGSSQCIEILRAGSPREHYRRLHTENHLLWKASSYFLSSQVFSGRTLEDGSSADEHFRFYRDWFSEYLDARARTGFLEVASSTYAVITQASLLNLHDFCRDTFIHTKAEMLLDWMWADFAIESLNGVRGGAKLRHNPRNQEDARRDGMAQCAGFLLGTGEDDLQVPVSELGRVIHAATSDYRVPAVIREIARDRASLGTFELTERRFDFRRYSLVTPASVLGGFQGRLEGWENSWVGLLFATSPKALMFPFSHPTGTITARRGDTEIVIPKRDHGPDEHFQHKGVLVTALDERKPTELYLADCLETVDITGDWVFVREGDAYAGWRPATGGHSHGRSTENGRFLVCEYPGVPTVLEAALADDYDSFDLFKDDLRKRFLEGSRDALRCRSADGKEIHFRKGLSPLVDGRSVADEIAAYPLFGSPCVNSAWDSGLIRIEKGDLSLVLDFRDPQNPKRELASP